MLPATRVSMCPCSILGRSEPTERRVQETFSAFSSPEPLAGVAESPPEVEPPSPDLESQAPRADVEWGEGVMTRVMWRTSMEMIWVINYVFGCATFLEQAF